jgi:hypothetical protein
MSATNNLLHPQVAINVSQVQVNNGIIRSAQIAQSTMTIEAAGEAGTRTTIVVPSTSFVDLAGNTGDNNIIIELDAVGNQEDRVAYITRSVAGIGPATAGVAVATSIATNAIVAFGSASVAQVCVAKSNLMRAGYHFQMMSMSASLAVPRIPGEV